MRRKTGLPQGLAGCLLFGLCKGFEAMGDAAPLATDGGVAGERLGFHLLALILLLAAAVLFFWAGRIMFRNMTARATPIESKPARLAKVFADKPDRVDAPAQFDADAALARYMDRKQSGGVPPIAAPRGNGFGRKQV